MKAPLTFFLNGESINLFLFLGHVQENGGDLTKRAHGGGTEATGCYEAKIHAMERTR